MPQMLSSRRPADAYKSVRDTAQEQPFISGLLVGALVGLRAWCPVEVQNREGLSPHTCLIASITTLTLLCGI